MPKPATRNASRITIERLNSVLKLDDPMTFQKVLLDCALSHHAVTSLAKQIGVRRETIWRYRTGDAQAPFGTIVKIIAVMGAKLVIVRD